MADGEIESGVEEALGGVVVGVDDDGSRLEPFGLVGDRLGGGEAGHD
jgi:hypothetical protein